jgi:hypothetical protein
MSNAVSASMPLDGHEHALGLFDQGAAPGDGSDGVGDVPLLTLSQWASTRSWALAALP